MTGGLASGVDHVIVAARDLEAARRDWIRLGFSVTPRGRHIGWGTANYCVMFPHDYIEILGVVDPSLYVHGLDRFLAERQGLQGAAFATKDAASAAETLHRAGYADDQQPHDLARILELPEGEARPAFKLVHPSDPTVFGMPAFLCQHLTPALIRRRAWLTHANGAQGIRALDVAVDRPDRLVDVYGTVFGAGAVAVSSDAVTVRAGPTVLRLGPTSHEAAAGLRALTVEVADADTAAALLDQAQIVYRRTENILAVDPDHATGVSLTLAAA
ncbi:MAG: VOC family protein [Inquilinaceae bacterium]